MRLLSSSFIKGVVDFNFYSVSLCDKTAYGILFTFDKLLMQFSCYHMPYDSNNIQIGALRRPMQGENIIFIQVLHHDSQSMPGGIILLKNFGMVPKIPC